MHSRNTTGITSLFTAFTVATAAFLLAAALIPFGSVPAYADTKEDLQAQADEIYARIDALQTELNEAMWGLENARNASEAARVAMEDAAARADVAAARQAELQGQLGQRVATMYRNGSTSFLDVFFGSASFQEFLTNMDYCNRVAARDATLVEETKQVRAEAESARAEYEEQKRIADEQVALSEELVVQIEETQAELLAAANEINSEIADIEAEEEAEAAAAAAAAAEAEAAQGSIDSGYSGGAGGSVASGSGYFCNPCPSGSLSSGFGYRDFDNSFHKGIDLAAGEGTPYYAAESGTVIYATHDGGYNGGAGNWIVISHGNGLVTKYMHSSAVYVSVGDYVSRGQNIGAVGNTGNSFGAHLHFQVELNGSAVSPWNYL